jgi:hypothetical protein
MPKGAYPTSTPKSRHCNENAQLIFRFWPMEKMAHFPTGVDRCALLRVTFFFVPTLAAQKNSNNKNKRRKEKF